MRKKSHISLTKFIVQSSGVEELYHHRKAFYVGSILPDCTLSFLTRRHCIEDTFHVLRKEILKITEHYDLDKGITTYYCRHLGVITHYVADYFTFPHNSIYQGNMKQHCIYEKHLKAALLEYVNVENSIKRRQETQTFVSVDELLNFIKSMHDLYLESMIDIEVDCTYIVELCFSVVDLLLGFIETSVAHSQQSVCT